MTKAQNSSMYQTKLFILILLVVLAGYLFMTKKSEETALNEPTPTPTETISNPDDLQKSQEKLNSVNVDSVDQGLIQLKTDTSTL